MAITDNHVEALVLHLKGEVEASLAKLREGEGEQAFRDYAALGTAAFSQAVAERFGAGDDAHVIAYISDLRRRSDRLAELDPTVAERAIRHSLGKDDLRGLSMNKVFSYKMIMLGALIRDAELTEDELVDFANEARRLGSNIVDGAGGS